MHYMAMLHVIGPIFKEEFKETKTVALGRRREELQGHPHRDHGQQRGWVRKLKKSNWKCVFSYLFGWNIIIYIIMDIFTTIMINNNQISGI